MTDYHVDVTTGDNGDTGLTEALAWQTLEYAMATAGTGGHKIWVKGSASYVVQDGANDCVLYVDGAGTVTAPTVWEGYTTTKGDGGVVTIDANTNTLASAVIISISGDAYHVFKHFRFTGGSGDGLDAAAADHVVCKYCRFDNNDGSGADVDSYCTMHGCLADSNGDVGLDIYLYGIAHNCIVHSNTNNGITVLRGAVGSCLSYENGGSGDSQIYCNGNLYGTSYIVGCTTDGGNVSGTRGCNVDSSAATTVLANNIMFDCGYGAYGGSALGELYTADGNLYYSNDTDRNNVTAGDNDVSGSSDPFTNSAGNDYTLKSGSEAIDAGIDISNVLTFWGL